MARPAVVRSLLAMVFTIIDFSFGWVALRGKGHQALGMMLPWVRSSWPQPFMLPSICTAWSLFRVNAEIREVRRDTGQKGYAKMRTECGPRRKRAENLMLRWQVPLCWGGADQA